MESDTALLDESRKGGKHYDSSCMIPSFIAGVLGVMLIGAIIGLIVMASAAGNNSCDKPTFSSSAAPIPPSSSSAQFSSSSASPYPPTTFEEYTAEALIRVCDSFNWHCVTGSKVMLYSFGPGKYGTDQYDDNGINVTIRQYSLNEDKTIVACQMVGTHGNCFNRTIGSNSIVFSTDGLSLAAKSQPCYSLYPKLQELLPNRSLDMCDFYVGGNILLPEMNGDAIYEIMVESDTGYPVAETVKDFQSAVTQSTLYASFVPGKPQDESSLQPFPNTPVYDLRDGGGNEQATFSKKDDASIDVPFQDIIRRSIIRSKLHLPLELPTASFSSNVVRRTVPRDVRDIPQQFDAREQWPECASIIGVITNQNPCGSCWAMSSAAVLADRMCISGNSAGQLSPQYLVYCGKETYGCQGGTVPTVWKQLVEQGTVTEECVPFTARNGACPARCKDGSPINDTMIFRAAGVVVPWDETPEGRVAAIQTEIMTNGSVQANFQVFDNFYTYSGGVYQRTTSSKIVGGHAVRIIGWGTTEDNVDYWIVANSWSIDWGEGGFFRILRGNNECNIEDVVLAGTV